MTACSSSPDRPEAAAATSGSVSQSSSTSTPAESPTSAVAPSTTTPVISNPTTAADASSSTSSVPSPDSPTSAGLLVDFDNGDFAPLVRSFGPTDNPATADPAYTVEVTNGRARFIAPAAAPGPRLTGFLDLPSDLTPVAGEFSFEWTFPVVSELTALGAAEPQAPVVAGCYIRGDLGAWQGGQFGDYWLGMVRVGGNLVSAIRQGNQQLVSEPFTATAAVRYRLEKTSDNRLRLFAAYDDQSFHQVGDDVVIAVNPGASADVAVMHLRVLDLSGTAIDVSADDFEWRW